jgi:transposase
MYSNTGRPSVPPERQLKAMVLMALYGVRSERLLCEQLDYNPLFRWFLDMDMVEDGFDPTTFSHNRQRLMDHDVARELFSAVVGRAEQSGLMSSEHFSVDGTLIEAWASMKSFRPKDEDDGDNNGWGDFRGNKRSNETHESTTEPTTREALSARPEPSMSRHMSLSLDNEEGTEGRRSTVGQCGTGATLRAWRNACGSRRYSAG